VNRDNPTLTELYASLASRSPDVRERAVERLSSFSEPAAFRAILRMASDVNGSVRTRVAESLRNYDRRGTVATLIRLCTDREVLARLNAIESLGILRSRTGLVSAKKMLRNDRQPLVRAYAAEAIGRIGDHNAKLALMRHFATEKSSSVRLRIAAALYALGKRDAWMDILRFLNDPDYQVRCAAAIILEECVNAGTRSLLIDVLKKRLKVEKTEAVRSRLREVLHDLRRGARRKGL